MRYSCEQVTSHHRNKGFSLSCIYCIVKFLGTIPKLQRSCHVLFLEQPKHEIGENQGRP